MACGETTLISGSTGRTCTGVRLRLERFILDTFFVFRSKLYKGYLRCNPVNLVLCGSVFMLYSIAMCSQYVPCGSKCLQSVHVLLEIICCLPVKGKSIL